MQIFNYFEDFLKKILFLYLIYTTYIIHISLNLYFPNKQKRESF